MQNADPNPQRAKGKPKHQAHGRGKRGAKEKRSDPRDAGKPRLTRGAGEVDSAALVEKFIAAVAQEKRNGTDLTGMQVHLHIHQDADKNEVKVEVPKKGLRGLVQKSDKFLAKVGEKFKRPTTYFAAAVLGVAINAFTVTNDATAKEDRPPHEPQTSEVVTTNAKKVVNESVKSLVGDLPATFAQASVNIVNALRGKPEAPPKAEVKDAVVDRRDDAAVVSREQRLNMLVDQQGANTSAPPATPPARPVPKLVSGGPGSGP